MRLIASSFRGAMRTAAVNNGEYQILEISAKSLFDSHSKPTSARKNQSKLFWSFVIDVPTIQRTIFCSIWGSLETNWKKVVLCFNDLELFLGALLLLFVSGHVAIRHSFASARFLKQQFGCGQQKLSHRHLFGSLGTAPAWNPCFSSHQCPCCGERQCGTI